MLARDTRWKDSLFSLPKKWLSTQTDSKDEDDTEKLTLPKLPVPPLKQTLDTYLDYATVIVSNPLKLDVTKKEIQAFSEGIGPQVQEFLEKRREETGNWISEWWQEDMYLAVRNQLPVHSNPGMVFPPRKFTKVDDMADLAATFVEELLDYKEILDNGDLQLERATSREKGQPLCMEQYYRLLGVCRIPNIGKDSLVYPDATHSNQHIVVACRNHFYVIPVVAGDRGRLNHGEIKSQILQVIADATVAPVAVPVGVLTAMNRDSWAKVKQLLVEGADGKGLEENSRSYDIIVKSLCMICLDEDGGDKMECDSDTNAMLRAMHGGGTNYHTANRWFDKTVQLVLSSDGTLGMCYEHSAAEGVAVIRLAERMLMREPPTTPTSPPALLPSPERLIWKIDMSIEGYIEEAKRSIDKIIKDLDFKVFTYKGYGKEFMKSTKTSPDVYIQLALQYTYLKMYGTLTSTYESASLRRFIGGRVDCIRSAHGPALKWAESMCAAAEDGAQKKGAVTFNLYAQPHILERFEAAAKKQTEVMVQNITGQGIDNHLLGLRNGSMIINNDKLPGMFTDETYKMMMEFKLSTSQVATSLDGTFMGYGPVVPDGYGVSYNPKKDSIIFCIASYNSSNQTCTDSFKETLNEVLGNMKMMFTGDDD